MTVREKRREWLAQARRGETVHVAPCETFVSVQGRASVQGAAQGHTPVSIAPSATVSRMVRAGRIERVERKRRQAVMAQARAAERARRVANVEKRERELAAVKLTPMSEWTLADKLTYLERLSGAPWRASLSEWHARKLREAGRDAGTIRRKGIGMVSGTETRASERWAPSSVRTLRDGTPIVSGCKRVVLPIPILRAVRSRGITVNRATQLARVTWAPFKPEPRERKRTSRKLTSSERERVMIARVIGTMIADK